MTKILFTGFAPFGGESTNPSWEAVALLKDEIGGAQIVRRQIPVEYEGAARELKTALEEERPDAVLCIGQAGGRTGLTPEMVAININDADIPDNAGVSYAGEPILEDGPAAYFATIPVKAITAAMREAGIPASVSYTAGTYVCNNLMYQLLDLLAREYPKVIGGFIHVPYECGQVLDRTSMPSLPLSAIAAGLEAAARVTAAYLEGECEELHTAAGHTH